MQAVARKNEKKPELRETILQAAQELFLEVGFEHFSMRRLARKVGYSPTTLYIYFRDKQDIIYSLCEGLFEQYLAELRQVAEGETDSLERLKKLFLLSIRFGCNHQDHYHVAFFSSAAIYGRPEEFLSRDSLARRSYFFIRQVVVDCIAAGMLQPADPELVTQALLTASHGIIAAHIFWKDFPLASPDVLGETLLHNLLEGFQA
jgi:AcrR family transcriptional regulator